MPMVLGAHLGTYCGYRKSQGGKQQVSEGSDELDVFPSSDSFQHIIQAGDPKENGLQKLNSLQQMSICIGFN